MDNDVVIETPRLRLRPITDVDASRAEALLSDPAIREFYPAAREAVRSGDLARLRDSWSARGFGYFAVELTELDSFIGVAGLDWATYESPLTPAAELGWLLESQHWGKGLSTEAARAVLDWAWAHTDLDEIVAVCPAQNFSTQAVMRQIGMTRDRRGDFYHPRVPDHDASAAHVTYVARRT